MDAAERAEGARERRLFVGVVLCWLAPNAIFAAFMQVAELRAPFDSVAAFHPAFVAYALVSATVAAGALTWCYRVLRGADREGIEAVELRGRIRRLAAAVPAVVTVYVLLGSMMLVVVVSDLALWSATDLVVAGSLAILVVIMILVPLGILCLDEFGVAFGHLVSDAPVLPSLLRSMPTMLLAVMICLLQPLHEYIRLGEVSPGSVVLVSLILPYTLAVTLLNLRYTSDALRSVFRFLSLSSPEHGLHTDQLRPQALDEFGVLIARTREVVTRLDSTRASLEESEQRLRAFAEAASDWFYELDAELRLTWVSERMSSALGIDQDRLRERTLDDIAGEWPSSDWRALRARFASREPFRAFELSLHVGAEARPMHLELSGVPFFGDDGSFRGYRGTGTDVSEVTEARRRLRERESQLAQAQKMEAVGQLTGGIAHDFNNLLTAMAGSLEVLRVQRPELAEDRLVREALTAGRRAGDLVQRLLAFSRRQALRPESVDVGEKLTEMAELLRRTLGASVTLDVDLPRSSVRAQVDPVQLESAVLNLAINARDAMAGGGTLRLSAAPLAITEAGPELAPGDYVSVTVQDSGAGIDPEVLPHVFEPFFSTKPDGAGSGLGLSMVYGFVRQSGGGLRVDSELGRGTRIELILPRATATATATARNATGAHRAVAVRTDARVLVVEDEPAVLAVVTEALELVGCSVMHAECGDDALAVLDGEETIDLVLSDVVLPGDLTGVDIVRRARERRPGLPCVLMSGFSREYLSQDADDVRDLPVLSKPFRLEDLIRTVTGVLAPQDDVALRD
jgi:PAS domain S-box-containing protein